MQNVFNIPQDETVWVRYMNGGVITHIITSDALRTMYYLYTVENNKAKKTRYKAKEPTDLYERINYK